MLAINMEPMVWGELVLELQQILKEQEQQEPTQHADKSQPKEHDQSLIKPVECQQY